MKTAKRQPTNSAQVAKLCKAYVKSLGLDCSVSSSRYSGGDSVRVSLPDDMHPAMLSTIKSALAKYQYGHFDGMQDMYEYSNRKADIPQTKYLVIESRYSDAVKQAAYDLIRATWSGFEGAPASYADSYNFRAPSNEWAPTMVARMLSAQIDDNWSIGAEFWEIHAAKPAQKLAA